MSYERAASIFRVEEYIGTLINTRVQNLWATSVLQAPPSLYAPTVHIIRWNSYISRKKLLHVSVARCHPQEVTRTEEYKLNTLI